MGLLLETEDGLTANWAAVKRVYGRFDKPQEWANRGATVACPVTARKLEPTPQARREETRDWLETGSASTGMVKGSFGGAAFGGIDAGGEGSLDRPGMEGGRRTGS